jgi:DNA-binding NarL/FixJ family response regulator
MRAALCAFLGSKPGIEVVGQAEDAKTAVRLAGELRPDVVLVDFYMPGFDGIEAIRRLKRVTRDMGVVLLSGRVDEATRSRALAAGASDCISKVRAFEELEPAIRAARVIFPAAPSAKRAPRRSGRA